MLIELIYENSCEDLAKGVALWLTQSGIAEPEDGPGLSPGSEEENLSGKLTGGLTVRRFTALREIAADSAVIFLSDEAAANQGWQQHVRALPENIRLIPVGTFVSADFSDPGVVPPRIEEINFIRTDERMRENILDSLTTDPSFYSMKNHLMVRYYSWSITAGGTGAGAGSSAAGSTGAGAGKPAGGRGKKRVPMGYEGNLLTDRKEIRRYREAFLRKASGEEDPYLKKQLEGILDYLDVSDRYARRLLLAAILRWTGRGVLFSLVAGIFVLFYRFLVPYYRRASYANIALSVDSGASDTIENAVRMTEALTNPFTNTASRKTAYEQLVRSLDKVWPNTPAAKYSADRELTAAAIPGGDRYLLAGTSDGRILTLDTWTGKTVREEKLTAGAGIAAIAVSPDALGKGPGGGSGTGAAGSTEEVNGPVIAALDLEGGIWLCGGDQASWTKAGAVSEVRPPDASVSLRGSCLVIRDRETAERFLVVGDSLTAAGIIRPENTRILAAEVLPDGTAFLAEVKDHKLQTALWDGERLTVTEREITLSETAVCDLREGELILTDQDGQVWRVSSGGEERTGLLLPQPLALKFADGGTAVYHERNMGTGLYDLDESFDYGDVLSDFHALTGILVSDGVLVMENSLSYSMVPVRKILKRTGLPEDAEAGEVINGRTAKADLTAAGGLGVSEAEIRDNGLMVLTMMLAAGEGGRPEESTVVLDPALVLHNYSGHYSGEDAEFLPEEYQYYPSEPFLTAGVPTVAGIRYVEANSLCSRNTFYVLVGCADGSFAELAVDPETGDMTQTVRHTVPSRSAIAEIRPAEGGYWLKDAGGRYWYAESGVNLISEKGIYDRVRRQLHSAVPPSVMELVSEDVRKELGLEIMP